VAGFEPQPHFGCRLLPVDHGRQCAGPVPSTRWTAGTSDRSAERDTQRGRKPKAIGTFVNTWSVDGFISAGLQPSELGWGAHEKWLPPQARAHDDPAAPSICLGRPGADTRVRTWCPTAGPQYGLCVTHNESISIDSLLHDDLRLG
jgi:homospermidine synthase